jgi:hypothetical protein
MLIHHHDQQGVLPLFQLQPDLRRHGQHHLGVALEAGVGRRDAERADDQVVVEELLRCFPTASLFFAPRTRGSRE